MSAEPSQTDFWDHLKRFIHKHRCETKAFCIFYDHVYRCWLDVKSNLPLGEGWAHHQHCPLLRQHGAQKFVAGPDILKLGNWPHIQSSATTEWPGNEQWAQHTERVKEKNTALKENCGWTLWLRTRVSLTSQMAYYKETNHSAELPNWVFENFNLLMFSSSNWKPQIMKEDAPKL